MSCQNSDYQRAYNYVKQANQNRLFPIVYQCQGVQGPPGPPGAATIEVGTTTTGEAGTEASVVNSGTSENVILDFVIPQGIQGETGPQGPQGIQGIAGPAGPQGADGITPTLAIGTVTTGAPGSEAAASITGEAPNYVLNLTIPQGLPGAITDFADYYAMMPPDNTATIAIGEDVAFPSEASSFGDSITRLSDSTFNLAEIGTYQIFYQVPVTEAGQLELAINDIAVANSVNGRATGTSNITGMNIIETTTENSVLSLRNPEGNTTALTITPTAGGTSPVSAHLIILKLQ
ncbi:MAG: collagen-like protein [Bacilli bacterium]|nr:collagen-like protein [Bacilli bacterium]